MLRVIIIVAVAFGATSLALPAGAVGQSFTVKVDGTPPTGDPWAFLRFFPGASLRVHPGDVIVTGTPEGVSPIEPGDHIVATIEKIGTMEVKVRAA